jgi:hypothetical protein
LCLLVKGKNELSFFCPKSGIFLEKIFSQQKLNILTTQALSIRP